jgi:RimJ/RimL family protein N-acetyltransferase
MDEVSIAGTLIETPRVRLREWRTDDAEAALTLFGDDEVARWLAPAMDRVQDAADMSELITTWLAAPVAPEGRPTGRWVIETVADERFIGSGQILPLPPEGDDLQLGYQLVRQSWGHGFASEAGHALAHYAFSMGEEEVFAVVRPRNVRGAQAATRIGMEWVGDTDKYYNLQLQVYRLRKGDLDASSGVGGEPGPRA